MPDTRALGMGEFAVANPDPNRIARLNPAALTSVTTTRLSLQYLIDDTETQDLAAQTRSLYSNFNGFQFAMPLGRGLHLSLGITTVTRVHYHYIREDQIRGTPYIRSIEGSGGLNLFYLSGAWQPIKNLSVGVSGTFAFGRILEDWRVTFPQGSDFTATHDEVSTHYEGRGITAGLLFRPKDWWILGAVFSRDIELDTRTDVNNIATTLPERVGGYTYPGFWGIGTSIYIQNKWMIGMDFRQTDWTRLAMNENPVPKTVTANQFSVGIEKIPNPDPFSRYLGRIPLRIGATHKPYFSRDEKGNTIPETWMTLGLGLPLFLNASHIDLALGFGRRGSLDKNGISENLMRLTLSLTGGERWFVRRF
ncbi:MAG TPA: hypothetical protein ENN17_11515 [bacterium]|nr:hypothetical protein [bacterium]